MSDETSAINSGATPEAAAPAEPVVEAVAVVSAAPVVTSAPSRLDDLQVGSAIEGTVKRIELFGAFVDIGVGKDGLLHISQLGQPNVRNVGDIVKVGEKVTVYVMKVDKEQGRIALSMAKQPSVSWDDLTIGRTVTGTITRLEKFGAFVDIGAERDAMIHVSELAEGYVNSPADVVKVGDEITAQIIKVNRKQRRIDLSRKQLLAPPKVEKFEIEDDEPQDDTTSMGFALRRAMAVTDNTDFPVPAPAKGERRRDKDKGKRERRHRDLEDVFERTLRGNR